MMLPHGFAKKYRDVCAHGHHYTMEEWSNLIWIGGAIAACGPVAFRRLWRHMFKFLKHYIYGVDTRCIVQQHAAHEALQRYAQDLEELAVYKQVCIRGWPQGVQMLPQGQGGSKMTVAWGPQCSTR